MSEKKLNRIMTYHNYDTVIEAEKKGKGILFLSGHYSNWELTAFSFSKLFKKSLKIIAKSQGGKSLNNKINSYRELGGNEIIQTGLSLRSIFEYLKRNEVICFLVDQSANPDYSAYINFFGQKTAAFSGPAKIALKKRPVLILGYGIRDSNYNYDIYFSEIQYEDITDYSNENVILLTQRIQSEFEKIISADPGQWLWLHKRFKHVRN